MQLETRDSATTEYARFRAASIWSASPLTGTADPPQQYVIVEAQFDTWDEPEAATSTYMLRTSEEPRIPTEPSKEQKTTLRSEILFWKKLADRSLAAKREIPGFIDAVDMLMRLLSPDSGRPLDQDRAAILNSRLTTLRVSFVSALDNLDDWLFVAQSANPNVKRIQIPERFVQKTVQPSSQEWDLTDVDVGQALESFLRE